ncbi:MAG: hypothetical protein ACRD5F_09445 [Candidatus Acidiferrales bacterium]
MKRGPGRLVWWVAIGLVAVQTYLVQELLAALALFTVVFLAFASFVGVMRALHFGWERLFALGEAGADSFNRRLYRRLRSETAR